MCVEVWVCTVFVVQYVHFACMFALIILQELLLQLEFPLLLSTSIAHGSADISMFSISISAHANALLSLRVCAGGTKVHEQ